MSINALPLFTPHIPNMQNTPPWAAVMPMLPVDPSNSVIAGIHKFSQLMQPKADSDESDTDEA